MRSTVLSSTTAAALLSSLAAAHITLETPKPYKFLDYGPTNPIDSAGAIYPCKLGAGEKAEIDGEPTVMVIGETQTASFAGVAVHGGGSCQFSMTQGFDPNKESDFRVIHSIEGGCPKKNIPGNIEDGSSPDTYEFTIPEGIEPGEYTFAWTWLNRIGGQPEYYMNCAPIIVKAGTQSRLMKKRAEKRAGKKLEELPGMFMANMGEVSNSCDTTVPLGEQVAISYPNPGDSVDHPEGTDGLYPMPCDGNSVNAGGAAPAPPTDPNTSAPASSAPTVAPPSTPSSAPPEETSAAPAPPATTLVTSVPAATSVVASTPEAAPTPSGTDSASGPAQSGEACTNEGYLACWETSFSTCTGGQWTAPVPLAAGTQCEPAGSQGVGLNIINPQ